MHLYGLICLNLVTKILRDVLDISYCDNIKMWMNYFAFWNYASLMQWLFPYYEVSSPLRLVLLVKENCEGDRACRARCSVPRDFLEFAVYTAPLCVRGFCIEWGE